MEIKAAVRALAALAQETRLAIFRLLVQAGPTGVAAGEIGAELGIAPATLSFHLRGLSHAGLARARQEGRFIYYSANFEDMVALVAYLTENCCRQDGTACPPASSCAPRRSDARSPRTRTKGAKA